jgi:16S rRNA (adenine1518-N6/adenine1519-N6)-dimethyltransferase
VEPSTEPELLTPARVRELLNAHGLAPRKAAGQNFVVDPNTVRKIVRDAEVGPHDVVLEVGAGLGSLTLALVAAAERVIAVEIDAGLVEVLRELVGDRDDVALVHADALRTDLDALVDDGPARLIANLPYNVATPIVMEVLAGEAIRDIFVMVQREVGERWVAGPGDPLYGAVSVKIALAAAAELVAAVPPTVFHPVPRVESVTVRLTRRPDAPDRPTRAGVGRVVDVAFAQRRKTLRNALRPLAERGAIEAALRATGLPETARAQELDVDDFVRLAAALGPPNRAAGGRG